MSFVFVFGMAINASLMEEQELINEQKRREEERLEKERLKKEKKQQKKKIKDNDEIIINENK